MDTAIRSYDVLHAEREGTSAVPTLLFTVGREMWGSLTHRKTPLFIGTAAGVGTPSSLHTFSSPKPCITQRSLRSERVGHVVPRNP